MDFDYQFLVDIYHKMLDDQAIFVVITGLKVVAVCAILITWYGRYLNATKDPENFKMPVTFKDIATAFGTIVLIGLYDTILDYLDYFFGVIEQFYSQFQVQPKNMGLTTTDEVGPEGDKGVWDVMEDAATMLIKIMRDPTYSIVQAVKGIAWFIDLVIYGVFIAERFFFLGILRILGAIALAFSYIPKFTKWFYNWLGLYFAFYLLIIPYFLVNAFTNVIYQESELLLESYGGGMVPGTYSPMVIVIFFIIWVKFKLYKGSREVVNKIFN